GPSTSPIIPAGKASVHLCHTVLYSYPRIRVRALPRTTGTTGTADTAGSVDVAVPDTAAVEHDATPAETSPRP
ncbi:hypothetical protein AB0M46_48460, partial [Dactylosporangium sp. NPDC051485]|uniref:hypothetical protein n=1 Tax=Dactylosporangium sp. NPDC051485 TaxID=3154846 RepID=UPI003445B384